MSSMSSKFVTLSVTLSRSIVMRLLAVCPLAALACDGVEEAEEDYLIINEDEALLEEQDDALQASRLLDELSAPERDSSSSAAEWSDKVLKGGYRYLQFEKVPGFTYEMCVWPTYGDPGLFGDYAGKPTKTSFHTASQSGGLSKECIKFTATLPGTYYFGVYGYTESKYVAKFTIS